MWDKCLKESREKWLEIFLEKSHRRLSYKLQAEHSYDEPLVLGKEAKKLTKPERYSAYPLINTMLIYNCIYEGYEISPGSEANFPPIDGTVGWC